MLTVNPFLEEFQGKDVFTMFFSANKKAPGGA
jgi:hypothetical protein